jgi:pimeloyl-ACP methyl ester carboxylesterase
MVRLGHGGSLADRYRRRVITDLRNRFSIDDTTLAWDRWGTTDGTPLFLCHGFSGSSHDFALHVEELADERGVVTIDHRGHGRSQNLGAVDRYSLDRLADDLIALVEREVGGPVDLLGHSMGGAVSLRVALARPDLVRSLILMDTSAWSFVPNDPAMAAFLVSFVEGYDPTTGLPDTSALANPEDALIAAATPAEWQALKAEMDAAFDPYAMKALGLALFEPGNASVRPRLGEITCPVTVIVGEHDHPFIDQAGDLLAELPDGALTVITGAYHSPQLTHSADWTAAVQGHLARSR